LRALVAEFLTMLSFTGLWWQKKNLSSLEPHQDISD